MSAQILRGATRPPSARVSEDGDAAEILEVRFSKLNTWYEISSYWEGDFLERVAPGAAQFDSPAGVRTLFNHGFDQMIGGKVLGVPRSIGERQYEDGLFSVAEVPLLDTSYVRDLIPGLRAGAYGSSFMFDVTAESWDFEPEESDENPNGLPMRTITGYRLYEQGPVTWPANPGSDAQINSARTVSGTDWLYKELERSGSLRNPEKVRSMLRVPTARRRKPSAGERLRTLRELEI